MDLDAQRNQEIKLKRSGLFSRLRKSLSIKENTDTITAGRTTEESAILQCIRGAREEWLDANRSFEYAYDEGLIDYYIYKIKASEIRYEYFLKKAKEMGIKAEMLENPALMLLSDTYGSQEQ